jgi:hypothetical protein
MQYVLLLYSRESGWSELSKPEQDRWMAAYKAYIDSMLASGILRTMNRLQPTSTGKTLSISDGKTCVNDGPATTGDEQISGLFIIDVTDMEAALTWAAKCPSALHGHVEVRPSWCNPEK